SKVEITGWISSDRVRTELLDSTALVLPSFAEGLPVVIMEAMALARPVVTTYIAGIPELVIPNENGWLVPAGSLESLVSAMREVLHASDEEIQKLGNNGRKRVIERHNIDTEAEKLASFFGK
ncbi:MAG: glycosyltransferase, partial [Pseudomonadota bacterium]